ncbi:GNAT family N-acetyltransferase [Amycolatopsis sp. MtRt-6]|uniref:GNAT family N-acetyltransferase n=1 Tax=Amycolatopsis sp. MtRt-6 TaxID=2792782 RepID=UPI001A902F01|nr:GNAT family N-acetyltransferase [Amycolatopsis sp. MtRt-6]
MLQQLAGFFATTGRAQSPCRPSSTAEKATSSATAGGSSAASPSTNRHAHGHGYATEAAGAVLEAAAATGRTRLWSTVGAGNTPSLRVLAKLGFARHHVSTEAAGEVVWLTRSLP